MRRAGWLAWGMAGFLAACGGGEGSAADASGAEGVQDAASRTGASCRVAAPAVDLPVEAHESSGLALSARGPGVLWTHNDRGGEARLFAVDQTGRLVSTVSVAGASAVDWEDMEAGPCGSGTCLWVGDIGDNSANRGGIVVYRIPEPDPTAPGTPSAVALPARFPDGPRDAEALFVLPTGGVFIINKGDGEDIALYRLPSPDRPGESVVLERVRRLFPRPGDGDDRVTAAAATPDGRWVGVRTYRTLYLYDADALVGGRSVDPITVDLAPLAERQGEGLALGDDGTVWLSSEAAGGRAPRLSRLTCALPAGDSAFAALQERGAAPEAMGVDQYASAHRFDDLPDGGRIELQDTAGDDAAVARIRAHMQEISRAFARGDFSVPGFVHGMEEVPGTGTMAERRTAIRYTVAELPRGAEVRIRTEDPAAVRAIHEFLAFQRLDHRAMSHDGH